MAPHKAFIDAKYKINFVGQLTGDTEKNLTPYQFETTIRFNGKIISRTSRSNWAIYPGFKSRNISIEAFDLISGLQEFRFGMPIPELAPKTLDEPMVSGNYEVMLSIKGSTKEKSVTMNFSFKI